MREYSLSGVGSAYAGASAQADGPEFVSFNPASSSGVADWDASVTVNGIYPTSSAFFSVATNALGTPTGGDAAPDGFIKDAYEPGIQARYRLSPELTAGLSITAPWGLSTRYNDGWAGRYYALNSKLVTVNTALSLAYAVTPEFAVSAGAQIQYAKGTLSNAIDFGTIGAVNGVGFALPTLQDGSAEIDADDWGFGFVLGALWKPAPSLSIGASYRSEVEHVLKGEADFTLDGAGVGTLLSGLSGAFVDSGASAALTTPAVASLGATIDVGPQVTLMTEFGYTWWNVFDELRVRFANPLQADVVQSYNWKDAYFASAGVRYRPAQDWTLRAGVAFDQSPTQDSTRDPRIPDADRTWLAFGVRHDFEDGPSVEVGYAHLFIPEEPIGLTAANPENLIRGNLVGVTNSSVDVITVQLTFR
ncbi:MAG: outer membrane protein transport protein [Alphaproteobacteria bacterium]|nr:outer membrane protein transport protein [Alphaproteobacteria bacterium]